MAKKKVQTQVKAAKSAKATANASNHGASGAEVVVGKNAERKQREAIRRAKAKLKGGSDIALFREQLRVIGLKIKEVTADGNCFFRAIADQLEGEDGDHVEYRFRVVEYMAAHEADFAPFVEDDAPFQKYLTEMRNDGTWAGNMELQAASLVTKANICIHRVRSPRWHIKNFDSPQTRTIHLSYHDGEHYNSVRREDDNSAGPALPIHIEADVQLTGASDASKKPAVKASQQRADPQKEDVKRVLASTACGDEARARQVLLECSGDVDAAIEFLIAEGLDAREAGADEAQLPALGSTSAVGEKETGPDREPSGEASLGDAARETAGADCVNSSTAKEESTTGAERQSASRNKACPCGSKKKFKACCGAAGSKADRIRSDIDLSNRQRKQAQKLGKMYVAESVRKKPSSTASDDDVTVDLGALCI